jgi:hypothetical protein
MSPAQQRTQLLAECRARGIEASINIRWEKGMPHHPKSVALLKSLMEADWAFGDDSFCWKQGGDGDNGETLMFEMDIQFELEELRAQNATPDKSGTT